MSSYIPAALQVILFQNYFYSHQLTQKMTVRFDRNSTFLSNHNVSFGFRIKGLVTFFKTLLSLQKSLVIQLMSLKLLIR